MRLGPPTRILAAAGVATLALVGLVIRENVARAQGEEVKLALAGYDPRSLLQGHFVQFQLRDTQAGGRCPPEPAGPAAPRPSWIALRRDGDHNSAVGAARTRAEAERMGGTVVRGRLVCVPDEQDSVTVALDLGVDRIHLDQEQAEAIQADLQRVQPGEGPPGYAVLSIGRDGKARVKGLIVGKRRVDLNWF